MAVTYTTAAERDARRVTHDRFALPPFEAPLLAASALAIVLLCAAYFGAVTAPRAGTTRTGPIVNLNTVAAAASLERVLEPVFPIAEDRRSAARELFAFLVKVDDGRRRLSSVGSLARIRVPDRSAGSSRECGCSLAAALHVRPAGGDQAVIRGQGSGRRARIARDLGGVVPGRISRPVVDMAHEGTARRSSLADRGARADRAWVCGHGQPSRSAARRRCCSFATPKASLPASASPGRFVRQPRTSSLRDAQLPAARRGVRAVAAAAVAARMRAGAERREGQSRALPADRGDPYSAGAVSRGLLRAQLGTAPGRSQRAARDGEASVVDESSARQVRAAGVHRCRCRPGVVLRPA